MNIKTIFIVVLYCVSSIYAQSNVFNFSDGKKNKLYITKTSIEYICNNEGLDSEGVLLAAIPIDKKNYSKSRFKKEVFDNLIPENKISGVYKLFINTVPSDSYYLFVYDDYAKIFSVSEHCLLIEELIYYKKTVKITKSNFNRLRDWIINSIFNAPNYSEIVF